MCTRFDALGSFPQACEHAECLDSSDAWYVDVSGKSNARSLGPCRRRRSWQPQCTPSRYCLAEVAPKRITRPSLVLDAASRTRNRLRLPEGRGSTQIRADREVGGSGK